ncbi:MAG: hypothetical protein E7381_01565 [Clostridiales bacterium]|nr:hypothetical protein [Clostridiales bacterium]
MTITQSKELNGRQIAFFSAFILPLFKLAEVPSLLAKFAKGDLLLPALLHFVLQTAILCALLYCASQSQERIIDRLKKRFGKWTSVFYLVYAVYFLVYALLPLLDLEKFVYAVFYDTAPTLFSFAFFFFFSAFLCVKGMKTVGRVADLSLFLFVVPFLALLFASLAEADFTNLSPLFEQPFSSSFSGFFYTLPHFSDVTLLLPLVLNLRFEKKDGVKITAGYLLGALFTLAFLAVFYGVYSTVASRQHYAFSKIAQYFPPLAVIGRVDLILVYLLCVLLFFATALPLFYSVEFTATALTKGNKLILSATVNFGAFLFVLFCNKYYDRIYSFFGNALPPLFIAFNLFPLLFLLLNLKKDKSNKEKLYAQIS